MLRVGQPLPPSVWLLAGKIYTVRFVCDFMVLFTWLIGHTSKDVGREVVESKPRAPGNGFGASGCCDVSAGFVGLGSDDAMAESSSSSKKLDSLKISNNQCSSRKNKIYS